VPFEASRFLGAEASARKVNLEAEEHKQLYRHSVDREGQRKPPSLPILFARRTTECVDRLWACQATSGTGEIVHHWNGTYWQAISDAEGVGVASDWIDRNADFAGSPKLAKDCWDMASLRLRQKTPCQPKPSGPSCRWQTATWKSFPAVSMCSLLIPPWA
jgi:hypothetical protein